MDRKTQATTRLNRFLAKAGIASRRKCDELIRSGRVKLNGIRVTSPAEYVDLWKDRVTFDGKDISYSAEPIYIVLNKAQGYITTAWDTHNRKTVFDLIDGIEGRIFSVGRLDLDTEGVLLLTNDGQLAFRLMHPRYEISKTYEALVEGIPDSKSLKRLSSGVVLDGKKTSPAAVRIKRKAGADAVLEIAIHQGQKRQIKRMCQKVGHPVVELRRTNFGGISAVGLASGKWRHLKSIEVEALKSSAGL